MTSIDAQHVRSIEQLVRSLLLTLITARATGMAVSPTRIGVDLMRTRRDNALLSAASDTFSMGKSTTHLSLAHNPRGYAALWRVLELTHQVSFDGPSPPQPLASFV